MSRPFGPGILVTGEEIDGTQVLIIEEMIIEE